MKRDKTDCEESSTTMNQDAKNAEVNTRRMPEIKAHESSSNTRSLKNDNVDDPIYAYSKWLISGIRVVRDCNSPFYPIDSFYHPSLNLNEDLMTGLEMYDDTRPSKIQEVGLPFLFANPPLNVIAQAQTGTRLVVAFALAILNQVNPSVECTQALCLSPTYNSAVQMGDVISTLSSHGAYQYIKIYKSSGEKRPSGKEHIIVCTPENILDWCVKYGYINLTKLKVFVLDEVDTMITTQAEFVYQAQNLCIRNLVPSNCQMMLFSATYNPQVLQFALVMIPKNAVFVDFGLDEQTLMENIKQYYVLYENLENKYKTMTRIYDFGDQFLIFCQTAEDAMWLNKTLSADGYTSSVALLSDDLTISQLNSIFSKFKKKELRALISTNTLARGIDFENLTTVINWNIPVDHLGKPDYEMYRRRIELVGQSKRLGFVINFTNDEEEMDTIVEIERYHGFNISCLDVPNHHWRQSETIE